MAKTIIGIDLGTTYSLASILQDGVPLLIPNALGETLTPSAVSLADDDTVLVGALARARATTHPAHTALAFKRDMGTERVIELGKKSFRPQELSALVLAQLRRDAEAMLGRPVDEAVITVPAYFGDAQRQATRDAGTIAGLTVERMINEPTAAALAYGLHARDREMRAVVLDLGGGTFDVTVLEILEGVIEIQASSGDARLGGEDFDEALVDLVIAALPDRDRTAVSEDRRARARLKEACEAAKKRLGTGDTRVVLPGLPAGKRTIDVDLPLTIDAAEAAWRPLLARVSAPIQRALRDASVGPEEIEEVLLVGGSTRLPCIGRLASQLFGRMPQRSLQPDEAIAMGAAVQAGLKAHDAALGDMIVTDVAPFSMGIGSGSKLGRRVISGMYAPIIERGTVIPASREEIFSTLENNQSRLQIEVFQGEHAMVKDNTKLGEYEIENLPALPAGDVHIHVRFTYDLNGILDVDMRVEPGGRTATLTIEGAPGRLTRTQVESARKAMAKLKVHPRESLPNATALARADALHTELVGDLREELAAAIRAFQLVIAGQHPGEIDRGREVLLRVLEQLRTIPVAVN